LLVTIGIKSPKSFSVFFERSIRKAILKTLESLPKTILRKVQKRGKSYSISVTIVSSGKMRSLNQAFRKKNRPTDVLSFSRLENPFPYQPQVDIGDLVICLPVARKQARVFQQSLSKELERLAVHGTLHLFGYDHEKSKRDEQIMFRLQDKILKKISPKHLKT
jgi:probable rRNA maturation factor